MKGLPLKYEIKKNGYMSLSKDYVLVWKGRHHIKESNSQSELIAYANEHQKKNHKSSCQT